MTRAPLVAAALLLVALAAGCFPRRPAPREATMEEVLRYSLRSDDEREEGFVPKAPPHRRAPPRGDDADPDPDLEPPSTDEGPSLSRGRPSDGVLDDGEELPTEGRGFLHRSDYSWGTDELVAALRWAAAEVAAEYPGSARVFVGDLSPSGGGGAPPHASHQTGRDVDIGYFLRDNRAATGFVTVDAETMDAEKTWALMERLVATGLVQYIFVEYPLQAPLREEAARAGWIEADLERLFQHPRGKGARTGVVRHAKGHDDHYHVRIRCPKGDEECRD